MLAMIKIKIFSIAFLSEFRHNPRLYPPETIVKGLDSRLVYVLRTNTYLTLEKTMSMSVDVHFWPITLQSLHSFEKFLLLILLVSWLWVDDTP